jgi:hypothetical protein
MMADRNGYRYMRNADVGPRRLLNGGVTEELASTPWDDEVSTGIHGAGLIGDQERMLPNGEELAMIHTTALVDIDFGSLLQLSPRVSIVSRMGNIWKLRK